MDCLKLDYCFPERPERRNAWSGKKVVQWEVGTGEKVVQVWLSVDPKAHLYPSHSPYVYCLNNPIKLIDPNGMEVEYASFSDRLAVGLTRMFNPEFRKNFKELKKTLR